MAVDLTFIDMLMYDYLHTLKDLKETKSGESHQNMNR